MPPVETAMTTTIAPPETPPPPPDFDGSRPMTILEHLQELRVRLIWCCLGLILGVAVSAVFTNQFFDFLTEPFRENAPANARTVTNKPLEGFTTYFKVALYGGLAIGFPIFVYQTLMFVLPGLTPQEKRWVLPIVLGIFVSFLLGAAFAFKVILPSALKYLLNLNPGGSDPLINIAEYISFVTRLVFWVGVTFQTPLVILALARFGFVTGRKLLGWWRYMIVVAFLVAAVVTPTPDPITQALVAGPLLVLYLVGVLLAYLFGRDATGARRKILSR